MHTLSSRITNLINNCNFQDQQTAETLKIMLLQHAIKYHEARDWIRLQDPSTLTYKTLLQHCRQLEQCCEQFRKAQQKGKSRTYNISQCLSHTNINTSRCHHIPLQPQLMLQMRVQPRQQGLPSNRTEMLQMQQSRTLFTLMQS